MTRYWVHSIYTDEDEEFRTSASAIKWAEKMSKIAKKITPDFDGKLFEVYQQSSNRHKTLIKEI